MNGGYAKLYDAASGHVIAPGLLSQSLTTTKTGEILDRRESEGQPQTQVEVIGIVSATTASGAAGAKVVTTITVEHGDDSGLSDAETFKTYVHEVAVDDNNGAHNIVVSVPVKLESAKRYIRVKALVEKSGTATLSAATGGLVYVKYPMDRVPAAAYSSDGYGAAVIA